MLPLEMARLKATGLALPEIRNVPPSKTLTGPKAPEPLTVAP